MDEAVGQLIQGVHLPGFDYLMRVITWAGNFEVAAALTLIIAGIWFWHRKFLEGGTVIVSTIGAVAISIYLKGLVARPRPHPEMGFDSFPSGHVMLFVGLCGAVLFLIQNSKIKIWIKQSLSVILLGLMILIGFSRVYLGAHWSSDVLGAYLLGSLWLVIVISLYRRL